MYDHTERLGQDKANPIRVQQGEALPGWLGCCEETLSSRRRRMFARCVFLITAGVFEPVLLVQSRTTGLTVPDCSAPKLTSLFSASPQSPCRLHQGEPGNQINQKAIRKAKRNTPPALRAVIFHRGAERTYITQTISYLALGVNRCSGFRGPHPLDHRKWA